MGTGRPRGWDRVLAGADGMVHAASCCAPDAWLTDLRPTSEWAAPLDEPAAAPAPLGRVHVIGTTC